MNWEPGTTEMMAADHGILAGISRNTGVLTVAYAGEKVFNFFLVILLVRYLSEEVFGQYGFISSYVLLFNVLVGLGFAALCTREISRRPEDAFRILTAGLPMACGLAVLAPRIVLFLMFMNGFMGNTLIAVDDQKALIIIVLSAFFYFGLLCVSRGIGMDEMRLIRKMLSTGDIK